MLLLLGLLLSSAPANMALVPEGDFWMGRYRLWLIDEIGWQTEIRLDDRPMHLVNLHAFLIDRTEVTNEAYARFVEETGHRAPFHWREGVAGEKPRLPVYNVSWNDARAFCAWAGKRLPTEAEWEKAARGGVEKTAFPWGDSFEPVVEPGPTAENEADATADAEEPEGTPMAHYGHPGGPTEVESFGPNEYGLHDVVGNVWEWVQDGYEQHYYSVSPRTNPEGPADAPYKVIRGGSWADRDDRLLSVFYRNFTEPETRTSTIGFRCAADPDREAAP